MAYKKRKLELDKYSRFMDWNIQYFSKLIYRFNSFLIKISAHYFVEMAKHQWDRKKFWKKYNTEMIIDFESSALELS